MNDFNEKMQVLNSYYVPDGEPKTLTDGELLHLEENIGSSLPQDYKAFLSKFGGFAPDGYAVFPYKEKFPKGNKGIVNVFFAVLEDDSYDLLRNFKNLQEEVDGRYLPIAQDPGGNLICIALNSNDFGKIYFWYHANEPSEKQNLYLVADSFTEFIDCLDLEE